MMRENESDTTDGEDSGDTIAFGMPPRAYKSGDYRGDFGPGKAEHSGWGQAGAEHGGWGQAGPGPEQSGPGWGQAGPPVPPPPRRRRRIGVYLAVGALAASIGAGATVLVNGTGTGTAASPGSAAGITPGQVPGPGSNAPGSGAAASLDKAAVENKVEPGLVDVTSTLKYQGDVAEGTGMIVSPSGLVLTNNHVIDGATSITASLVTDPGRRFAAQVVGYDESADVALLKLTGASGLHTVRFGNSGQVSLGTPVLALGNALGRGGVTPAEGIINALDRSIQASDAASGSTENLTDMLQTNAQIRQGDSGGALANNAGQVIGMITAARTSPGPDGGTLGFAIPVDTALRLAGQIDARRASSAVYIGVPGFLGVEVASSNSPDPQQQAADQEAAAGGGDIPAGTGAGCQTSDAQRVIPAQIAPASRGALVLGVLCGTAASAGGLRAGDVITSVDGQPVSTPGSLTGITARYHPGAVIRVRWESVTGASRSTSMTLGPGPAR